MNRLEAGKIINTHGLRGEVKVSTWTNYPEDFEDISFVYVKRKTGEERRPVRQEGASPGDLPGCSRPGLPGGAARTAGPVRGGRTGVDPRNGGERRYPAAG